MPKWNECNIDFCSSGGWNTPRLWSAYFSMSKFHFYSGLLHRIQVFFAEKVGNSKKSRKKNLTFSKICINFIFHPPVVVKHKKCGYEGPLTNDVKKIWDFENSSQGFPKNLKKWNNFPKNVPPTPEIFFTDDPLWITMTSRNFQTACKSDHKWLRKRKLSQ